MKNQLNYVSILTLKEIALRQVVVISWNKPRILESIQKFFSVPLRFDDSDTERWRETIESEAMNEMKALPLPESLKKQMAVLVNLIGFQYFRWAVVHERYLNSPFCELGVPVLAKVCWTSEGTINYQETAEKLLRGEMLDIEKRYKLACLYCLDDYIPVSWKELPEEIKKKFYMEEDIVLSGIPLMQFYWPHIFKGELFDLDKQTKSGFFGSPKTFYQYAFEYSALSFNKAAVKYFFQKLTHEEREVSLIRTTLMMLIPQNQFYHKYPGCLPIEELPDVLRYLLSLMNHEQQMQIFKEKPSEVLCFFLDWPWQDLFLEIADLMREFLPEMNHKLLLLSMDFRSRGTNDYFSKLFREFFKRSPIEFKNKLIELENSSDSSFIKNFYDVQDFESIEDIFKNLNVADRMRLVSSERFLKLCYTNILQGNLHFTEMCLREANLSKEDRKRLVEVFETSMPSIARSTLTTREYFEAYLLECTFLTEEQRSGLMEASEKHEFKLPMEDMRGNMSREMETNDDVLRRFRQILDAIDMHMSTQN